MNNIQIFQNEQFGKVRIAMNESNEPLFCLADVCGVIGIANARNVRSRLEEDDVRQMDTIDSLGRNQQVTFITESGLYDVIIRSDSEKAKPFRKWVTSEVLPSIRKHGAYMTSDTLEKALTSPDFLIQLAINLKEATAEEMDATVAHINEALEKIHCKRRLGKEILRKSTPQLTSEDLHRIMSSGYVMENYEKMDLEEHSGFESQYFMNVPMTAEKMQKVAKEILEDSSCGAVFRIKGFIKAEDNSWIQLNATHNGVRMEPIQEGQEVIIVIGEHLRRERIDAYIGVESV